MPNRPRHILVVDDNPAIHQDFKKIFSYHTAPKASLDDMEAALFGDDAARSGSTFMPNFEIDFALQGHEAVQLAREARQAGRPYAVAFVDIRMPPGMDGLETTVELWRDDPDIEVAICTAYSDYSWNEMLAKLGRTDRLMVLKKPFDNIEVLQIANALSEKWRVGQQARQRFDRFAASIDECSQRLSSLQLQLQELVQHSRALDAGSNANSFEERVNVIKREFTSLIEQHRRELTAIREIES